MAEIFPETEKGQVEFQEISYKKEVSKWWLKFWAKNLHNFMSPKH